MRETVTSQVPYRDRRRARCPARVFTTGRKPEQLPGAVQTACVRQGRAGAVLSDLGTGRAAMKRHWKPQRVVGVVVSKTGLVCFVLPSEERLRASQESQAVATLADRIAALKPGWW